MHQILCNTTHNNNKKTTCLCDEIIPKMCSYEMSRDRLAVGIKYPCGIDRSSNLSRSGYKFNTY